MKLMPIDINGLGYAAMHQPNLAKLSYNGQSTSAIFGVMVSVMSAMKRYAGYVPLVLWDGRAQWRHDMLPETGAEVGYKGDRGDTPEKLALRADYKRQSEHIKRLFLALGIPQLACPYVEADDLAGFIARDAGEDDNFKIITKDTDYVQAINQYVSLYSPLSGIELSVADFATDGSGRAIQDVVYHSIEEFIVAKCLSGDTSDKIPGIERVGPATAVKLLRRFGSLQAYFDQVDNGEYQPKGVIENRIASLEGRALYNRNKQLMDWRHSRLGPTNPEYLFQPRDYRQVDAIAEEFGIQQTIKTFDVYHVDEDAAKVIGDRLGRIFTQARKAGMTTEARAPNKRREFYVPQRRR